MRGLRRAVLLILMLAGGEVRAQSRTDAIPRAMRMRIVGELESLVRTRFAHRAGIPGGDVDGALARYRERALATNSRWDFSLETRAMIASLRNGHTTFSDPWTRQVDPASLPFTLGFVAGQWTVTSSRQAGVAVGDVVLTIDGVSAESTYAHQARYISASNDRMRRREFTARGFLWPRRMVLALEGGRTVTVERSIPPSDSSPPPPPVRDWWIDSGRVAYLAIRTFNDPAAQSRAIALVTGQYRNAATLIVDVRDNNGGSTPSSLTRVLLNGSPYTWWKEDPDLLPPSLFDRMGARFKRALSASGPGFAGKVILLVNAGCASACEDFVMPLAWRHRAYVIGDTTAGTTGQPVFARFDNGMQLSVSARRAHFPDGSPFEGVGVAPDYVIPMIRRDLLPGTDRVLDAAIARARAASGSR